MKIQKEEFINIWNLLNNYNERTKILVKNKINIMDHDKELYDCVILLLKVIFEKQEQIDLILFSIFDLNKTIETDDDIILIDDAESCWEQINK